MCPHSFYVTWSRLPDGIALGNKFDDKQYMNRYCCVCFMLLFKIKFAILEFMWLNQLIGLEVQAYLC